MVHTKCMYQSTAGPDLDGAELEHVARAGGRVALGDGVQEGDEVAAHARGQLLRQPKVQQNLHHRKPPCYAALKSWMEGYPYI